MAHKVVGFRLDPAAEVRLQYLQREMSELLGVRISRARVLSEVLKQAKVVRVEPIDVEVTVGVGNEAQV
jgi:hypothetical protein